jgi:drug/metabolite transporter (DMT)-like permease
MTFVTIYLVGYFLLFFGALFALWQAGVLRQIPDLWIALAVLAAVAFGVLLAVASRSRRVTTSPD